MGFPNGLEGIDGKGSATLEDGEDPKPFMKIFGLNEPPLEDWIIESDLEMLITLQMEKRKKKCNLIGRRERIGHH